MLINVMSKVILHTIIDIHSIRREAIIYSVKREAMKLDNGQQGHLNVFPLNALSPLPLHVKLPPSTQSLLLDILRMIRSLVEL